jgi:aryl-alcohol dehydrogenase-like predicted oxidoreductase
MATPKIKGRPWRTEALDCSIPGPRNSDQLNENLGAINVQLTHADLREIDAVLSKVKVHGGRMNNEQMQVVDQR